MEKFPRLAPPEIALQYMRLHEAMAAIQNRNEHVKASLSP
jgi:hypothetical protein